MKKLLALILAVVMMFVLAACTSNTQEPAPPPEQDNGTAPAATEPETAGEEYVIATVVKLLGISWFDRSEQGLLEFGKQNGLDTFMVGPETADSAQQVNIVEDLIAQNVNAICVIPISPEAMEPVLKKAREAGIVAVSHEATNLQNIDFNVEAFDNEAYGEHLFKEIGRLTGGQGKYAQFVGSLTATSHNEWVDAGEAYQKANFPDMILVTDRLEDNDDTQEAYNKTRELLMTYPDLRAIQVSSMGGTAGVGLAIDEMGLQDQVVVVGTCLVSVAGEYLASGAIDRISFWDPALAAHAYNKLALMTLEGRASEVVTGFDMGIEGYNDIVVLNGNLVYGAAWLDANKDNMGDFNF